MPLWKVSGGMQAVAVLSSSPPLPARGEGLPRHPGRRYAPLPRRRGRLRCCGGGIQVSENPSPAGGGGWEGEGSGFFMAKIRSPARGRGGLEKSRRDFRGNSSAFHNTEKGESHQSPVASGRVKRLFRCLLPKAEPESMQSFRNLVSREHDAQDPKSVTAGASHPACAGWRANGKQKRKNPMESWGFDVSWCPGEDSNLHALASART